MKIFLADDHQIFRESIHLLLSFEEDMEVVGEASNGGDVIHAMDKAEADLILMDVSMHGLNGIETTRLVKQAHPNVKVLILSMNSNSQQILQALEAGVDGYLLKTVGKNEVLRAIRALNEGNSYYCKEVTAIIVQELGKKNKPHKIGKGDVLSAREIEILKLIAQEFSNPEIAKQLFISVRTVESHRRNILDKLGVKNTAGLVRYAIENELL